MAAGCSPRRLLLVPLLLFLALPLADCSPSPESKDLRPIPAPLLDCFKASPQRALSNAVPSHEFFNASPEDCLRFCANERRCNTMVYHRHFSTCQLYAGAQEGKEAQEVSAKGHDLYEKKGVIIGGQCEMANAEQQAEEGKKEKRDNDGAQVPLKPVQVSPSKRLH